MVTFIPQLIQIAVLILIVWIIHSKIGEYPEPLPISEDPKREVKETILLWSIFFPGIERAFFLAGLELNFSYTFLIFSLI